MIKGQKQDVTVDSMLHMKSDLSICKKLNTCVAPNGVMFSRDKQGFFLRLWKSCMTRERHGRKR